MRRATLALMALLAAVPAARAQNVEIRLSDPSLSILRDYALRQDETARDVLVIAGDATIAGHVDSDVVVIGGKAQVASTAKIDGSLVVVAGTGVVADGAHVGGDVVTIGNLDAPASFSPGGKQVVIGTFGLDERVRGLIPWLTRGLVLGRPIVPDLGWVWIVAGFFFLINLLVSVVLDAPVRACATTLRTTPLSAFLVGLLVLVLAGPLCLLLAISVVGIAVIPFLACALLLAAIIGRVAFARWIGMSLLHESEPPSRAEGLRSFVLGSALMCVSYMVPVLGFTVWALAGVFGLGAAAIAFVSAYRRENPRRPKKTPAPEPPPVPPFVPPAAADLPLQAAQLPPDGGSDANAAESYASAAASDASAAAAAPESVRRQAVGSILSFSHATFLERLAAFVLDCVLIAILSQVVRFDRLFGDWSPDGNLLLVALVYHIAFWTWKQTTVGGIIMQLRVTRTDGTPMRFAESLVRGLGGIFSLLFAGLGFVWILRDPERQAWHDRIAGTFVVNVPRNWPI